MDSTLPILAVDLGQFNSVLCWFHTTTGELRFRTIRTTPDDSPASDEPAALNGPSGGNARASGPACEPSRPRRR